MTAINYVRDLPVVASLPTAGCRSQAFWFSWHPPHRQRWGFGSIRSWLPACRRRVAVLMVRFPQLAAVSPRLVAV